MHVGAVAIFEGKPPPYRDLLALIDARLDYVPRYRQRLEIVPLSQPVWVDEEELDLEYHVRHTALPRPGGIEQLKKLAGRLFSQRLDRDKPLWELWFIEGLGENRFAILSKTHHCMIDGVSGVDLATVLMSGEPQRDPPPPRATPWTPRPSPSRASLLGHSLKDQLTNPLQIARDAMEPSTEARRFIGEVAAGLKPLLGLAQMGQAPESSINRPIGPHRRFEMVRLELSDVKKARAALGGTINDLVLTVVTGALRRLLLGRGDALPPSMRVMVPVSVRAPDQRGTMGNQVTAIFCPLPIAEPDPIERLRRVTETMRGLKESKQAIGALALTRLGDFAPPTLLAQAARVQAMTRFFNLVVTNVPGPQFPLYLLEAKLAECYPAVPLASLQTIGIALLSYNGAMGVGILADQDGARDVAELGESMHVALRELIECASETRTGSASVSP
jgi:WS/DGAT/MGAT family acyltransferase